MPEGTIIFVHGTGTRLKTYKRGLTEARAHAASVGIKAQFEECAWGDPLGVTFGGLSLPDPPSEKQLRDEEEDFAKWSWLFDDPLFELDKLTIRDTEQVSRTPPGGKKPAWKELWDKIAGDEPSVDLKLLLDREGLGTFWPEAWSHIVVLSNIPELAFERSAHELPQVCGALARALVAELHAVAVSHCHSGPQRALRNNLVLRLLSDWNQQVFAPSNFLANLFMRATTRVLRRHRNDFTDGAALPIGDILLYQSRGAEVRDFIRKKIENQKTEPPVTLVAHSLGGIACFDLLALSNPPSVARLVTVGSQSPLLYEIGALVSLKRPQPLPNGFPPWLNIFDRNDFLSYVAEPLFAGPENVVVDREVESGHPFPQSHSAYFSNDRVWTAIRDFGIK